MPFTSVRHDCVGNAGAVFVVQKLFSADHVCAETQLPLMSYAVHVTDGCSMDVEPVGAYGSTVGRMIVGPSPSCGPAPGYTLGTVICVFI